VPQTGATGQIIKKPKKPKKPKAPQAVPGAVQVLNNKPRPQSGENKRKPAAQRAVAAGEGTSPSSGNPFSVRKPRSKPASKPAGGRSKRGP
jgi:hypothetical protein